MSLRIAQEEDARGILEIYAPLVESDPVTFECEVPSEVEIQQRIRNALDLYPWWVVEEGGRILGYAYGSSWRGRVAYRFNVEVSVYVHPEAQRRGLGRRLYTALLKTLQLQGYCVAYGAVTLPNDASACLHEELGFERVAHWTSAGYKLERWHDVGWWARALNDWQPIPTEPIPFSEFRHSAACEQIIDSRGDTALHNAPAGQKLWERSWQPPDPPPAIVDDELKWVDPQHRRVQRLGSFIFSSVVMTGVLAYSVLSYFLRWTDRDAWPWVCGGFVLGALLLAIWNDRYAVWQYRHYRYRLTVDGLEIQKGVWWRSRTTIPRSRVQHTDVAQGPIQRRFGLASLSLHTAGTSEDSVQLAGLKHPLALEVRDYLIPKGAGDAV